MNQSTQKLPSNYAAIAGFGLLALLNLINMFRGASIVWGILSIIACGAVIASIVMNMEDPLVYAGLAVLAIIELIYFIRGFGWTQYHLDSYYGYRFNFFAMLPAFIELIAYVLVAVMAFLALKGDAQQKRMMKSFWFIPAALLAISRIFALFLYLIFRIFGDLWYAGFAMMRPYSLLFWIVEVAAFAFILMWVTSKDGVSAASASMGTGDFNTQTAEKSAFNTPGAGAPQSGAAARAVPGSDAEGYCGMAKHVLLLLFTFGIWYMIWIYRTTAYTNKVEDEPQRNPVTKLLLCLFIPFYTIYWVYKTAQRIDKMAAQRGVQSDIATLCLILEIFIGIVPPIIMQDKINSIAQAQGRVANGGSTARAYQGPVPQAAPEAAVNPMSQAAPEVQDIPEMKISAVEEIKQYKELLDAGILTQEEFEAKKKQILGLGE